ncbi:MAG: hypothetical protein IKF82_07300 [Bacilli bacterium]|nr:hypothetical protein [Bacilli bacterium]
MNISFWIFVLCLILVIVFFKDFRAFVYFVVAADILLRLITYFKANIIKDTAFVFLNSIPNDVPSIIKTLDLGMFNEILIFIYVVIYMVFEGFLIRNFIKRKF